MTQAAWDRGVRVAAVLILIATCAIAGWAGVRATADLMWPPGTDFSRDIASAQTLQHGWPWGDPTYAGEIEWYNPLVPGIGALLADVSRAPIHVVYARAGAYVNLLVPVALFVLAWRIFGPPTAACAVLGLVFLVPNDGSPVLCARYSPWLLPVHTVQWIFYVSLLALVWAWRAGTWKSVAVAGGLAGVTFLGHTAPFLLLVACVIGDAIAERVRGRAGLRFALVYLSAAALVSSPFWAPVLWRYHFAILNGGPSGWNAPEMAPDQFRQLLRSRSWLSPVSILMAIGFVRLVSLRANRGVRLVLLVALATTAGVAYSYVVQAASGYGVSLPAVVPGFHFLYYLGFVGAVAFGCGLAWLPTILGRVFERLTTTPVATVGAGVATATLALALVGPAIRTYPTRWDFVVERKFAQGNFEDPALVRMYQWVLAATRPGDVFLAPENLSLSVIATAGRKAVAVPRFFSSPYVDWDVRHRDGDEMQRLADAGDAGSFAALASKYRVRWIARYGRLPSEQALGCCVRRAWESGGWVIYERL